MTTPFAMSNLSVFERHGATVEPRDSRSGCWVKLPNGWTLSIQWGACNYGSNQDLGLDTEPLPDATSAEIAAWHDERGTGTGMVEWVDGVAVLGWCSMDRVQHVLDLLAEDKLLCEYQPPAELRADDGWTEAVR